MVVSKPCVKRCSKCGHVKFIWSFSPCTKSKDGKQYYCKQCNLIEVRAYAQRRKALPPKPPESGEKRCHVCKITKALSEFNVDRCRKDGCQGACRACCAVLTT